ncbi:MAG: histidine ammonia-lyase [Gammaproteobacteria bacterium]|nr:histidine ammonia-lyase [Gammaproteobacteria bacterium]
MKAAASRQDLVSRTGNLIFALENPSLEPFLASWPAAGPTEPALLDVIASTLPVLRWLPSIAHDRQDLGAPVIDALCQLAPSLAWRQTYTADELGPAFMRDYGYTEIIGPSAMLRTETMACGFLLLGPATLYPRHRHEAEEIYVILSGDALWLQGDETWREHAPGTVVHHATEEPHAMRTGDRPLLALYLWRGAGLNQKARLEGTA